jgi:hypothetical protein
MSKPVIRNRLDSHEMLLRALVEMLTKAEVINQQQLRETAINRGLHWRIKALRYLLGMLK